MSRSLPHLVQLETPLTCSECNTTFLQLCEEDGEESPVHCRECGAYICSWGYLLAHHVKARRGTPSSRHKATYA